MSTGKMWRRPPVLLALCLVSVGGVVTLLGHLAAGSGAALKRVELSNDLGFKAYPAFAPDGQRLAYSARGVANGEETFHIFVRDVTVGAADRLTKGASNDIGPAWSPDGTHIAFVRVTDDESACVVIPVAGGDDERKFPGCTAPGDETQPYPGIAWTRDGASLIVSQAGGLSKLTLADGKFQPLTHVPKGADDSTPAVSPDGGTIAFLRSTGPENADIFLCDSTGGNPRRLTFDGRAVRGIAWSRDGMDVLYTGERFNGWRVWRLPSYGASPRDLLIAGRDAQYVAVAPVGTRMVYTTSPTVSAIWRAKLTADEDTDAHAVVRSTGRETGARYSPDGKWIADISDQSGNDEIWLSDTEGGNRVQVTSLKGPDLARIRWSPDGKSLIFDASAAQGSNDLYIIAAGAGAKPFRVQSDAFNGSWSHDGKSIYFQARNRIWKSAVTGGEPQPLSSIDGAAQPVESADGKYIYFRNGRSFWRVPIGGGDEEQTIVPEHDLMWSTTMQLTRQGMYYIEFERNAGEQVVSFFDFAQKRNSVVFRVKNGQGRRDGGTYSVSPDGKSILYSRVDQSQTKFEVVENFR